MNFKTLGKAVISLAVLAFILRRIMGESFSEFEFHIEIQYVVLVFIVSFINIMVTTYKWDLIIQKKKIQVGFIKLLKLYFLSNFLGQISATIIGDSVRAYNLAKYTKEKITSITSVFWVRVTGGLAQLILIALSLPFVSSLGQSFVRMSAAICWVVFFISLFMLLFPDQTSQAISKCTGRFKKFALWQHVEMFSKDILEYSNSKKFVFVILTLSLLDHFTRIVSVYFVSLALGFNVNFYYFLIFVPISMFVYMIPISLGGVGVREGTYIFLFTKVGMTSLDALTLSVFTTILTLFIYLPGAYFFVAERYTARKFKIDPIEKKFLEDIE